MARGIPAVLMAMVFVVGAVKVGIGLSRGRPVIFLILLCLPTIGIAISFLAKPVFRTRAGDRMMSQLRQQNAALRTAASTAPQRLANVDLALAIALFGPTILSTGDLLSLRQAIWPVNTSWGGGGGCGSG